MSRFLDSKSSPFISYPTASISFHLSFLTNVSWKVGQISALATVAFKWRRGHRKLSSSSKCPQRLPNKMTKYFPEGLFNFVPRLVHNSDHLVLEASIFNISTLSVLLF